VGIRAGRREVDETRSRDRSVGIQRPDLKLVWLQRGSTSCRGFFCRLISPICSSELSAELTSGRCGEIGPKNARAIKVSVAVAADLLSFRIGFIRLPLMILANARMITCPPAALIFELWKYVAAHSFIRSSIVRASRDSRESAKWSTAA